MACYCLKLSHALVSIDFELIFWSLPNIEDEDSDVIVWFGDRPILMVTYIGLNLCWVGF